MAADLKRRGQQVMNGCRDRQVQVGNSDHFEPPTARTGWVHELKQDGYRLQIHVREVAMGARRLVAAQLPSFCVFPPKAIFQPRAPNGKGANRPSNPTGDFRITKSLFDGHGN
jgi:hypothetical protein